MYAYRPATSGWAAWNRPTSSRAPGLAPTAPAPLLVVHDGPELARYAALDRYLAVAVAAGLHVSRADGSALVYNCANPYLPDLLICRKELADEVLRLAAEYSRA